MVSLRWAWVLLCWGCVEVPELARDNPCDPAVRGVCRGASAVDAATADADESDGPATDAVIDQGVDGSGEDATVGDAAIDARDPDCPEPAPESCNGADDDCDGLVDELAPIACYSGPVETRNVGACRTGVIECEDARWTVCTGAVLPEIERCDEADNDCDGVVDEALACE